MDELLESGLFNNIDPAFIEKVRTTIDTMGNKSDIETIGTFMAISNEASQKGIQLNDQQQKALVLFLRDTLPPEKRQKFDLIISMIGN